MNLQEKGGSIIGTDREGKATFANPAAAALTGWTVEEIQSVADVHELTHRCRNAGPEECPIFCAMDEGRVTSGEESLFRSYLADQLQRYETQQIPPPD